MNDAQGQHDSRSDAGTAIAPPRPAPTLVDRSVIHDLRNPLSALSGNLQLVQSALEDLNDTKNLARVDACLMSLNELAGMLTDLHLLVLMNTGELETARKKTDLRILIRPVVQAMSAKADLDGKSINLADGPSPSVPVMPQLITRAIHNLIISTLRVCKTPPIVVQLEDHPGQFVRVVITYQGIGVPSPLSNHLFDLECGHSQEAQGLRLDRARGLYLSKAVIELHGGEVHYEPLETGGRFVVQLPY